MFRISPLFSVANRRFNVVILAAGLGTRLKPATDFIPKALVEVGGMRAIDHSIRKYQYIAERIIIASGYCADLLENYVCGKYPSMDILLSREEINELRGPGKSLLHSLDYASSRLPTIVTFCDYLVKDEFSVDEDSVVICRADSHVSILGTYKTLAVVDEGLVLDIVPNDDEENKRDNGFTGIFVCHNTLLLKSIVYGTAAQEGMDNFDYSLDIVRPYVQQVRTIAAPLRRMLEFGTEETLDQTRRVLES